MGERVALVRRPSSRIAEGIVTYGERLPVDAARAAAQHDAYVRALADAGWAIHEVEPADDLPDSAFVEDTVVVCGDLAVLARPGAPERRAEVAGTEEAVRALGLEVARIEEPGTLDGGDVLRVGTTLYAGRGGRTNEAGIEQLRRHAASRGYEVVTVPLNGVLHLKSAVTALPDGTLIAADPSLVDVPHGDRLQPVPVPLQPVPVPVPHGDRLKPVPILRTVPEEAGSHVVPLGGDTILMAASAPRTAELFDGWGLDVVAVDIGEFEKMEGCVSCLSVLVGP